MEKICSTEFVGTPGRDGALTTAIGHRRLLCLELRVASSAESGAKGSRGAPFRSLTFTARHHDPCPGPRTQSPHGPRPLNNSRRKGESIVYREKVLHSTLIHGEPIRGRTEKCIRL